MNNKGKGETASLILMFLPTLFAIISMIFEFEIYDLLYLIIIFGIVVRYYINKKKA